MEKQIYLDYNATTPIDADVVKAMMPFLESHFGNPSSSYPIGRNSKDAVNKAREQVASLLNANPAEIYFTSGGTESNNMAIRGIAAANREKGNHIISSEIEHPAILEVLNFLSSGGWVITLLPVDSNGTVNPYNIKKAIRKETVLITIMHANNETGAIQPISEISAIAKKNNVFFHTDAAQSVGKINSDVKKLGVDLLTIAGHKLYAPKGVGALYVKKGTQIKNIMFGAGQEKGLRPGTENVPYIVALGKACELANVNFEKNTKNMRTTRDNLLNGLISKLPGLVHENINLENCLPNTLSVSFKGVEAHTLASLLSNSVNISTGSACHADSIEISPVLKAMKIDLKAAASTVRISTGKYTSNEEIDDAIAIISDIVKKLNK